MTFFLHIGLSKTGSTFLQNWLYEEAVSTELERQFNLYEEISASTFFWKLISDNFSNSGLKYSDPIEKILRFEKINKTNISNIQSVISSETQQGGGRYLFSAEGFSDLAVYNESFVDSRSFAQIINLFKACGEAHGGLRIILVIRRQDQILESTYMQNIRSGSTLTFEEFLEVFPVKNLNWLELIYKLETLVGVGNVRVIPYERPVLNSKNFAHYLQPFLECIDERIKVDVVTTGQKMFFISGFGTLERMLMKNASLQPEKLPLAIEANKTKSRKEALDKYDLLAAEFPKLLGESFGLFSEIQKKEILTSFKSSNREIFRKFLTGYDGSYYLEE